MSVDWTQALWPASYKGVPFWVDRDTQKGGQRVAVHEFPGSDMPFVEPLGQKANSFSITAYLVGDASQGDASTLSSTFNSDGSGPLVLPLDGPLGNCYCDDFTRNRSKDKMCLVAYDAHFWLDGSPTAVVSAAYASQLAYDAVEALGAAMAAIAATMSVESTPGWVAEAAIAALQGVPAALEVIRAQGSVSASSNLSIEQSISAFFAAIPGLVSQATGVSPSIASTATSIALSLVAALPANSAAIAFGAAYDALPPSMAPDTTQTANVQAEQANAAAAVRLARLTMLSAHVQAVLGMDFTSRPDGVAARTQLVCRFAKELAQTLGAANVRLYVALENLRNATVAYLTAEIADLQPVINVSAPRMLPSLWWAWKLYQDPTQAPNIVARNKTRHPSFCQMSLEVLAPTTTAPLPA